MEQHDYENLKFLMSLNTKQQWREWAEAVGEDDLKYASALLTVANWELIDQAVMFDPLLEAQALCEYMKRRT